ncbi:hypothetical protein, partial [Ellagibacter isourolithinifaciens]|uniref:hypothetical protein n=1 Tax=Ellagibacter isourolithinifaciens TaxID=2137581 RepID=UPI003A8F4B5B
KAIEQMRVGAPQLVHVAFKGQRRLGAQDANEKNCSMCVGFGAEPFEAGASESEKPRSRIWQLIGIRARFANTYAHRAFFRIPRCVKAEMGYAPHADWARN